MMDKFEKYKGSILELSKLQDALKVWEEDKDHKLKDYSAEFIVAKSLKATNDYSELVGYGMYAFGVKNELNGKHDVVLGNSLKNGKDVEILLCCDASKSVSTESIAVSVMDLCLIKDDEMECLDRLIEIQESHGYEGWTRKSVALTLRTLLRRFVSHMSSKQSELGLRLPKEYGIMCDILNIHGSTVDCLVSTMNSDLYTLNNSADYIKLPVISYYHCVNYEFVTSVGVLSIDGLMNLYSDYIELEKTDKEKASELLSKCNDVLSEYYLTYYSNVAKVIPNALLGFICIATIYMTDDYGLFNIVRSNIDK